MQNVSVKLLSVCVDGTWIFEYIYPNSAFWTGCLRPRGSSITSPEAIGKFQPSSLTRQRISKSEPTEGIAGVTMTAVSLGTSESTGTVSVGVTRVAAVPKNCGLACLTKISPRLWEIQFDSVSTPLPLRKKKYEITTLIIPPITDPIRVLKKFAKSKVSPNI